MLAARSVIGRLATNIGDDALIAPDFTLAVLTFGQNNNLCHAGCNTAEEDDHDNKDRAHETTAAGIARDDAMVHAISTLSTNTLDSREIAAMPLFVPWQEIAAFVDDAASLPVRTCGSTDGTWTKDKRGSSTLVPERAGDAAMEVQVVEKTATSFLRKWCREHLRELTVLYHILLRPREAYQCQLSYDRLMEVLASKDVAGALIDRMEHAWKWHTHAKQQRVHKKGTLGGLGKESVQVSWKTFLTLYADILALYFMHAEEGNEKRTRREHREQEEEQQQQRNDGDAHSTSADNVHTIIDASLVRRCLTLSHAMNRSTYHCTTTDGARANHTPPPRYRLSDYPDNGSYHVPRCVILLTCVVARQAHAITPQALQPMVQSMLHESCALAVRGGDNDSSSHTQPAARHARNTSALDCVVGVVAMASLPLVVQKLRERSAADTAASAAAGKVSQQQPNAATSYRKKPFVNNKDNNNSSAKESDDDSTGAVQESWAQELLCAACHSTAYDNDVAVHFRQDGLHSPLRSFASATLASVYARFYGLLNLSSDDSSTAVATYMAERSRHATGTACSARTMLGTGAACSNNHADLYRVDGILPHNMRCNEQRHGGGTCDNVQSDFETDFVHDGTCVSEHQGNDAAAVAHSQVFYSPADASFAVWRQFTPYALFSLARSMRLYAYAWRIRDTVRREMIAVVRSLLRYAYTELCASSIDTKYSDKDYKGSTDSIHEVASTSLCATNTSPANMSLPAAVATFSDGASGLVTNGYGWSDSPAACTSALSSFVSVDAQRQYFLAIYAYASAALPYLCGNFESCASDWIWPIRFAATDVGSNIHRRTPNASTQAGTPRLPGTVVTESVYDRTDAADRANHAAASASSFSLSQQQGQEQQQLRRVPQMPTNVTLEYTQDGAVSYVATMMHVLHRATTNAFFSVCDGAGRDDIRHALSLLLTPCAWHAPLYSSSLPSSSSSSCSRLLPRAAVGVGGCPCPLLTESAFALAHSLLSGFAADMHHVSRRVGFDLVSIALTACRAYLAHTASLSPYVGEMTLALVERYDTAMDCPQRVTRTLLQPSVLRDAGNGELPRVLLEMYLYVHLCYRHAINKNGNISRNDNHPPRHRDSAAPTLWANESKDDNATAASVTAMGLLRMLCHVPAGVISGRNSVRGRHTIHEADGNHEEEAARRRCNTVRLGSCSDGMLLYLHVLHYVHTLMQLCPGRSLRQLFLISRNKSNDSFSDTRNSDTDAAQDAESDETDARLCRRVWEGTVALLTICTDSITYCPVPHISLRKMLRFSLQLLRRLLCRNRHRLVAALSATDGRATCTSVDASFSTFVPPLQDSSSDDDANCGNTTIVGAAAMVDVASNNNNNNSDTNMWRRYVSFLPDNLPHVWWTMLSFLFEKNDMDDPAIDEHSPIHHDARAHKQDTKDRDTHTAAVAAVLHEMLWLMCFSDSRAHAGLPSLQMTTAPHSLCARVLACLADDAGRPVNMMRLSVLHMLQRSNFAVLCSVVGVGRDVCGCGSDEVNTKESASVAASAPPKDDVEPILRVLRQLVLHHRNATTEKQVEYNASSDWHALALALQLLRGFGATRAITPAQLWSVTKSRAGHHRESERIVPSSALSFSFAQWMVAVTNYLNASLVVTAGKPSLSDSAAVASTTNFSSSMRMPSANSFMSGLSTKRRDGIGGVGDVTQHASSTDDNATVWSSVRSGSAHSAVMGRLLQHGCAQLRALTRALTSLPHTIAERYSAANNDSARADERSKTSIHVCNNSSNSWDSYGTSKCSTMVSTHIREAGLQTDSMHGSGRGRLRYVPGESGIARQPLADPSHTSCRVLVTHDWFLALTQLCAALEQTVWLGVAGGEMGRTLLARRLTMLLFAALNCFGACWKMNSSTVNTIGINRGGRNQKSHHSGHAIWDNDKASMWSQSRGRLCGALLSLARSVVQVYEDGAGGRVGSGVSIGEMSNSESNHDGDDDYSSDDAYSQNDIIGDDNNHHTNESYDKEQEEDEQGRAVTGRVIESLVSFARRHAEVLQSQSRVNDCLAVLGSLLRGTESAALSMYAEQVFAVMLRLLVRHLNEAEGRTSSTMSNTMLPATATSVTTATSSSLSVLVPPLSSETLTLVSHVMTFFSHSGHLCPARVAAAIVPLLLQAAARQSRGVVIRASVHACRGTGGGPHLLAFCRLLSCAEMIILNSSRDRCHSSSNAADCSLPWSCATAADSLVRGSDGDVSEQMRRLLQVYEGAVWGMNELGGGGQAMDDLCTLATALAGLNVTYVRHADSDEAGDGYATRCDNIDGNVTNMNQNTTNRLRAAGAQRIRVGEGSIRYARQAWHVMWCALLQFWHSVVVVLTTTTGVMGSVRQSDTNGTQFSSGAVPLSVSAVQRSRRGGCRSRHSDCHDSHAKTESPTLASAALDEDDLTAPVHDAPAVLSMSHSTRLVTRLARLLVQLPRVTEALAGWQIHSAHVSASSTAAIASSQTRSGALFAWDVEEMMWCTRVAALLAVCNRNSTEMTAPMPAPSFAQVWLTPIQHGFTQLSHLHRLLAVCWPSEVTARGEENDVSGDCSAGAAEVRAVSWFSAQITRAQLTFFLAQPRPWTRPPSPPCNVYSSTLTSTEYRAQRPVTPVVLLGIAAEPAQDSLQMFHASARIGAAEGSNSYAHRMRVPHALTFDTLRRFIVQELQQLRRSWHDGEYSNASAASITSGNHNNNHANSSSNNNNSIGGSTFAGSLSSTQAHSNSLGGLHAGSNNNSTMTGYGNSGGWHGRGSSSDTAVVSRESSMGYSTSYGGHGGATAAAGGGAGSSLSGVVGMVDGINDAATESSAVDDVGVTGGERETVDGHDGGEDRVMRVDAVQLGLYLFTQAAREVVAYCQDHREESEDGYGSGNGVPREYMFTSRALQELRVCCQKLLRVLVNVRREMRRSGMLKLEQMMTEMCSVLIDVVDAL